MSPVGGGRDKRDRDEGEPQDVLAEPSKLNLDDVEWIDGGHFRWRGKTWQSALVRTPETLDVERLANALDSVDIDEFDTLGAFNSTGYARAILAVLPFATPSPTPPEGLLTELAERHLDRRYPPPGHAAWREPELPASEWRAAYFVLARIALEQLDECRERLRQIEAAAKLVSQWHDSIGSGPIEELNAELGDLWTLTHRDESSR